MRLFKKLGIFAASIAVALGLVACAEELPIIDMTEDEITDADFTLKGVEIITDNAKTVFYLGEEFSTEGLVVEAVYSRPINDEENETKRVTCDRYTVNTDQVRINEVGRYSVTITYRDGITKVSN